MTAPADAPDRPAETAEEWTDITMEDVRLRTGSRQPTRYEIVKACNVIGGQRLASLAARTAPEPAPVAAGLTAVPCSRCGGSDLMMCDCSLPAAHAPTDTRAGGDGAALREAAKRVVSEVASGPAGGWKSRVRMAVAGLAEVLAAPAHDARPEGEG